MKNLYDLFVGDGLTRYNFILTIVKNTVRENRTVDDIRELCQYLVQNAKEGTEIKIRQITLISDTAKVILKLRFLNGKVVFPKLQGRNYLNEDGTFNYPSLQEFIDYEIKPLIVGSLQTPSFR